eukprot:1732606-Amphidinium_carterae.1
MAALLDKVMVKARRRFKGRKGAGKKGGKPSNANPGKGKNENDVWPGDQPVSAPACRCPKGD